MFVSDFERIPFHRGILHVKQASNSKMCNERSKNEKIDEISPKKKKKKRKSGLIRHWDPIWLFARPEVGIMRVMASGNMSKRTIFNRSLRDPLKTKN